MRTNVVIDDELMAEALQVSGLSTKKAVIDAALRLFVQLKSQEEIRTLRGQLHWEGDLDQLRTVRMFAERPDVDYGEQSLEDGEADDVDR